MLRFELKLSDEISPATLNSCLSQKQTEFKAMRTHECCSTFPSNHISLDTFAPIVIFSIVFESNANASS